MRARDHASHAAIWAAADWNGRRPLRYPGNTTRCGRPDDIQKAYRKLAREYHPDLNPDDETAKRKFQAVPSAFDVLSDPQKRQMYDRYGSDFEAMGGGAGVAVLKAGPAPPVASSSISTWATCLAKVGRLLVAAAVASPTCSSSLASAAAMLSEPRAVGTAEPILSTTFASQIQTAVSGGEAVIAVQRLSGKVENITVKIPPGIDDGKKIRLRGQGEPGVEGGPAGDILITIHTESHPYFQRRGKRLDVRVPVTLAEAIRGAKIDVPTPTGHDFIERAGRYTKRNQVAYQGAWGKTDQGRARRLVCRDTSCASRGAQRRGERTVGGDLRTTSADAALGTTMVIQSFGTWLWQTTLLAQQATLPAIERLDPPRRAAVLMALLGLVLLGITLVACVMIGGRWVRNASRRQPSASRVQATNSSATWRRELAKHLPEVATSDTVIEDRPTDETRL